MSRDFPDWVNPWTAGEGRREYHGTIPLDRMARLGELLADAGGEAEFHASFRLDEDRRPLIDLWVSASMLLTCQASLQPYAEQVERRTRLAVVDSEAEMARLSGEFESTRADGGRLAFVELVEDELLLGLPQVPRRPDLATVAWEAGAAGESDTEGSGARKPFADLARLMRKRPG